MFRIITAALVVAVFGALLAAIGSTSALYGDTATSGGSGLTAGTVNLKLANDAAGATDDVTLSLDGSAMKPGDWTRAPLTVSNAGTLELRYGLTSTLAAGQSDLASALTLTILPGTCSKATGSGAVSTLGALYSGALNTAPSPMTVTLTKNGSPSVDYKRVLAAAASETLCLTVQLPTTAATTLQSKSATITFSFAAEQTANN